MEQTCTFFVHHPYSGIPKTINNSNNILICLCIIHHESLKVGFNIPVFEHCAIELCPHDLLCFGVFRLHVTNYNGHHFAISWIINMTDHGCPTNDSLHMVKHDPRVFQITFKVHSCNKPNSAPNLVDRHLEKKNFLTRYLAWETTFLNKIVTTFGLQLKDVVNVTST